MTKNLQKTLWRTAVFVFLILVGCSTDNPPEEYVLKKKIRLGIIPDCLELNSLILLAEKKGYFRKYGIDVEYLEQTSGVQSLNNIENGTLDLGLATEYVFVKKMRNNSALTIISTIAEGDQVAIVLKADSTNESDRTPLEGKSIGVVKGSGAEYFLDRFLTYEGTAPETVSIAAFQSPGIVYDKFLAGNIDAMILWQPYIWKAQTEFGSKVLTFPAQSGQSVFWNLYARAEFVIQNQKLINSFMKSLVEAETFLHQNGGEGKSLVYEESSHSYEYFDSVYKSTKPGVALDHSLLVALESELRWIIEKKSSEPPHLPNLLPHFSFNILDEVKPDSVNIIHQKDNR